MASQTQGIQQLLAAEKIAAEKVSEARKRKCKLSFWKSKFDPSHSMDQICSICKTISHLSYRLFIICYN